MIKVVRNNGILEVVIPLDEYEKPWWVNINHINNYTEDETTLRIPCREDKVKITQPILTRTPMGVVQQENTTYETWTYFDMYEKSILVSEGDDITNEIVDLKIKEPPPMVDKGGKDEVVTKVIS